MNVLGHYVQNDSGIRTDWNKTKLGLWKCFWSSCGSRAGRSFGAPLKVKLLQRSVLAFFQWKLSRWPFQKTIAIEIDALQCQMLAIIMQLPRSIHESIDQYCRRRRREARNLASECCFWSTLWARRVIKWDEHVQRGVRHKHVVARFLNFQDANWLQRRRSEWVSADTPEVHGRNSLTAGQTGTRLNVGRPQVRWDVGVVVARESVASALGLHKVIRPGASGPLCSMPWHLLEHSLSVQTLCIKVQSPN